MKPNVCLRVSNRWNRRQWRMPEMEHDKTISFLGNLHSPALVVLAMQNWNLPRLFFLKNGYDGSTSNMTSRSIRVESNRFNKICNPFSQPLEENFRSVLQIDFRYDGSTSTVTSRIESIRHHLQPPFVVTRGIFSKCLADRLPVWQVDFNWDESVESIRKHLQPPFSSYLRNIF